MLKWQQFACRRLESFGFDVIILVSIIFVLSSCRSDTPDEVLDEDTMENVLYDFHLAQNLDDKNSVEALTRQTEIAYNENYLLKSVLKKYQISQSDFDSSLEWYAKHSELLFDIYKHIDERMSMEMGAKITTSKAYGLDESVADTIDIWRGARCCLLSSVGQNVASFEQECDTSLHHGDQLVFQFKSNWIYREGMKSAVACLSLKYDNDSTIVSVVPFYGNGTQSLSVKVGAAMPLKKITGYIYQQAAWDSKPKLLVITNISLVRLRIEENLQNKDKLVEEDSVSEVKKISRNNERLIRDSLLRDDSLQRVGHHFK